MISKLTVKIANSNIIGYYTQNDQGGFFLYDRDTKNILINNECTVVQCRESFAVMFKEQYKRIGFVCKSMNIEKLNEFFEEIENKLNLTEKTLFIKSNHENTVIIRPAPFWLESYFHKQVLTLFIRCGAVYYNGDFAQAIDAYHLTRTPGVKEALYYFLDNNTKPTYDSSQTHGFVTTFQNANLEQIKQKLVKP